MEIEGYRIEGLSIAGHETCIILPTLDLAFDIGKCPQRAIARSFLFISHGHMDHIGGLPMHVATRGLYSMKPPTIIVPAAIKEAVEKLFEVYKELQQEELKYNLIGLNVGEEFYLRKDVKVRAFRTYHGVPSQGYVVYSVKQKLKQEYNGLSGKMIKNLKFSGVEPPVEHRYVAHLMALCLETYPGMPYVPALLGMLHAMITDTVTSPEVAFTGDTMSDFMTDDANVDVLKAKVLIMECTYLSSSTTVEKARDCGHTHVSEIINHANKLENRAILLIHFSARHKPDEIQAAVSALPPPLAGRVFALTEGF